MDGPFNNFVKFDSKVSSLGLIFDLKWQFLNFKAVYFKMVKIMISCLSFFFLHESAIKYLHHRCAYLDVSLYSFILSSPRVIYQRVTQTALIVHCFTHTTEGGKKLVQQVIGEPVFTEAAHLLHGYCVCEEVGRLSLALQVLRRGHEAFPRVCDHCLRCWIYCMQSVVEMSKRTVHVEEPVRPLSSHLFRVQRP